MKDFAKRMFSDGFGFPSLQRVIAACVIIPTAYCPLAVWTWVSIRSGEVSEFPGTAIGFIGAILGPTLAWLFAGKVQETKVEIADISFNPKKPT
jgi:hypothetical protein